jgi:hypothetical protein
MRRMVISLCPGVQEKSSMQPAAYNFYNGVLVLIWFGDMFDALIAKLLQIL